eukprot:Plantae.Rhodophyta-Rhodochaete_pulchella.ctg11367.p1 GENE.Plantae.Rhodophyta-Rhodochaete_pulchella.ctg11367~~Plantae.Rhodophyta-Rhodochaete_pulchella.ctg11367.p1  ORF type:complete len:338 (-),score=60.97 Plantae.Rhodophyta-Rhodochaete_pulchella.ctg11367:556-1569(-)
MLSRVDEKVDLPQALCLAPTREVARQIKDVVETLGKFMKVKVFLALPPTEEEKKTAPRPTRESARGQIVVGTPGKVISFLQSRVINPSKIKVFVLDEADQMVNYAGMGDQTIRIKRFLPKEVQSILFSATYADAVRHMAEAVAPHSDKIEVKREELSLARVKQYYIRCESSEARYALLADIYASLSLSGQSVIFVRRVADAKSLTQRLRAESHTVSVLHGQDMTTDERDRVIDEFREGKTKVLVSTDLFARGVDVLQISIVINYDLPVDHETRQADPETYLHRVGRTGRFGRTGIAINFIFNDTSAEHLRQIEQYYNHHAEEVKDAEELEERIKSLG